jgi:hypothetical protein
VPHVSGGRGEVDPIGYEVAAFVEERVDPEDREAGVMQGRRHDRTDVSVVAGDGPSFEGRTARQRQWVEPRLSDLSEEGGLVRERGARPGRGDRDRDARGSGLHFREPDHTDDFETADP